MDAGVKKKVELCVAFTKYSLGQKIMSHADLVIERNSRDILADAGFSSVQEALAQAQCTIDDLPKQNTIEAAESFQTLVQQSCPQLLESLQTWSPARFEEKWVEVEATIQNFIEIQRHGVFLITKGMIGPCMAAFPNISAWATQLLNSVPTSDGSMLDYNGRLKRFQAHVDSLWLSLWQARKQMCNLKSKIQDSAGSYQILVSNIAKLKSVSPEVAGDYEDVAVSAHETHSFEAYLPVLVQSATRVS